MAGKHELEPGPCQVFDKVGGDDRTVGARLMDALGFGREHRIRDVTVVFPIDGLVTARMEMLLDGQQTDKVVTLLDELRGRVNTVVTPTKHVHQYKMQDEVHRLLLESLDIQRKQIEYDKGITDALLDRRVADDDDVRPEAIRDQ